MLVGVVEVQRRSDPARPCFFSRGRVAAYRIKRWPKRDSAGFYLFKYALEFALRHRERVVFKARGSPGRQLQLTIRPYLKNGERAVGTFQGKPHNIGVERDTGTEIVDLEDDVIERGH